MDEAGTSNTVNIEPQRRNQRKTINQRNQHNKGTHSFHKKPISKPFQRKCDIYVSNKSNFKVFIDSGESHIVAQIDLSTEMRCIFLN